MSSWKFDSREDLEAVLGLESPDNVANDWLDANPDRTHLSHGYLLHVWTRALPR